MNNKGEEINKSNRFEIKVDIQATHPHYVLFADETGCNSSMKKDGHIRRTKNTSCRGAPKYNEWQQ